MCSEQEDQVPLPPVSQSSWGSCGVYTTAWWNSNGRKWIFKTRLWFEWACLVQTVSRRAGTWLFRPALLWVSCYVVNISVPQRLKEPFF